MTDHNMHQHGGHEPVPATQSGPSDAWQQRARWVFWAFVAIAAAYLVAEHRAHLAGVLIRVERPLDIDSQGQLVASVLSKKVAAGSEHVLVDIPVGPTAKVRSDEAARDLAHRLEEVGRAIGLHVRCMFTDGTQPVGRGVGPALEARDVLP